jgi:hypothetical protein
MRVDGALAKMPAFRSRALALAEHLSRLPGVHLLPAPPQVNMFHLHVAAPPAALAAARDRIAEECGVWIAPRFAPAHVTGTSFTEIYVGDGLLAAADQDVLPWFAKLAASAQKTPA